MPDIPAWIIELSKYAGFPVLMFVVWYLYHREQVKQWKEQYTAQQSQWMAIHESSQKQWREQMEDHKLQRNQTYELLNETLDVQKMQIAQLARIEESLANGKGCKATAYMKVPQIGG